MPERRRHRGPHPDDAALFGADQLDPLRAATRDLSWLFSRGYAEPSALKLVGDRYALTERQRIAVKRCACSDAALARRQRTELSTEALRGGHVLIDAFNVLTTVEAALAGGALLRGRDGALRDMASMHGSYRKVQETQPALAHIGDVMQTLRIASAHWLIDSPVSNSGRLKTAIRETAEARGWAWDGELVPDPDALLGASAQPVATADSVVLDRCARWFALGRVVVQRAVPRAWIVDLSDG